MQLLVSVRSASEVEAAVTGGADIIDAKEPSRGSLGPVDHAVLREILRRVPSRVPLSVALGDVSTADEVAAAISSLELPSKPAPLFLKLGFAGVRTPQLATTLLECAAAMGAKHGAVRIVAVAYADAERAETLEPGLLLQLARRAGVAGALLDTYLKDGHGLLGCMTPRALAEWTAAGRRFGLLTALAGELKLADVGVVCRAHPDVIGVRGAACEGGRGGVVTVERVRALRHRLGREFRVHVQSPLVPNGNPGVGETPEDKANSVGFRGPNSSRIKA
jgi:(5-formylfuran-3-yl)methyl phosphate synthase